MSRIKQSILTISTILLGTTFLTTGCEKMSDQLAYLFESKEAKAERENKWAEWEAENDSYGVAYGNCVAVVRKETNPASLQFPKNMQDLSDHNTDNGWRAKVFAQDINGSYTFTCYTDKNGKILRVALENRQQ